MNEERERERKRKDEGEERFWIKRLHGAVGERKGKNVSVSLVVTSYSPYARSYGSYASDFTTEQRGNKE
jgi:hypothetical protein